MMSFLENCREYSRAEKIFVFATTLGLVIFAGLRGDSVTFDYSGYLLIFDRIPEFTLRFSQIFNSRIEPGFSLLVSIAKAFFFDNRILFVLVAVLSVGIASIFYKKMSNNFHLTMMCFFCHTYIYRDMTQIRSALAAAIGLGVIYATAERRYIPGLLCVLFSALFHYGGAILLLGLFLFIFLGSNIRHACIGILCVGLVFYPFNVASIAISLLPKGNSIYDAVTPYIGTEYSGRLLLADLTNIKNLVFSSFILLFWNRLERENKYFTALAGFFVLGVAWRIAFDDFEIIAARLATFLTIGEVILVPAFVSIFKERIFATFVAIGYCFVTLSLNSGKAYFGYDISIY